MRLLDLSTLQLRGQLQQESRIFEAFTIIFSNAPEFNNFKYDGLIDMMTDF